MATNTSRFRLFGGLFLAVVSAATVFAPVVSADEPTFQPDAWIKRSGGPTHGKYVYNLSGVDQSIYLSLPRNVLRRVYLTVQNQGNVPDTYGLMVICCGSDADTVRYFRGRSSVEITDEVEAGTFVTPLLDPGETYVIRVTVRTNAAATPGSYYARKFIFSAGGGGVPDAVRMWVIRR
jgi:hypothetical protein